MSPAESTPQTLIEGLTLELAHQNRVAIFTLTQAMSRAIVDAWYRALEQYLEELPTPDRRIVYDFSPLKSQGGLIPYARQRLVDIAKEYPLATGRVAVIYPQAGLFRSLVELFIRHNSHRVQRHIDIRMFTERQKGIEWVEADLSPLKTLH